MLHYYDNWSMYIDDISQAMQVVSWVNFSNTTYAFDFFLHEEK